MDIYVCTNIWNSSVNIYIYIYMYIYVYLRVYIYKDIVDKIDNTNVRNYIFQRKNGDDSRENCRRTCVRLRTVDGGENAAGHGDLGMRCFVTI